MSCPNLSNVSSLSHHILHIVITYSVVGPIVSPLIVPPRASHQGASQDVRVGRAAVVIVPATGSRVRAGGCPVVRPLRRVAANPQT